jgi:hypothetical protein
MPDYRSMFSEMAHVTETLAELVLDLIDAEDQERETVDAVSRRLRNLIDTPKTTASSAVTGDASPGPWSKIGAPWLPDTPAPSPTATAPAAAGVYAIPGPPPIERTMTDSYGGTWQRIHDGRFIMVMADAEKGADPANVGAELTWPHLIATYGPITLLPLTEQEEKEAALYGPPGQRWGDPYKPCPYVQPGEAHNQGTGDEWYGPAIPCRLGVGHTGPHRDLEGNPLGMTEADGTSVDAGITLAESVQTACNCGHPEQHRPGCPRYAKTSGGTTLPVIPEGGHLIAATDLTPDSQVWQRAVQPLHDDPDKITHEEA